MSTKPPTRQERDGQFSDHLTSHVYLGRDHRGRHHHLDRATGTVHVLDGPDRVARKVLGSIGRPEPDALEVYIDAVTWADRRKFVGADLFGGGL